jgi:hypothetical protein
MDMHSREQYLVALREAHLRGHKKLKTRLLNEARKRTKLNRKVLIRRLTRVPSVAADKSRRRVRGTRDGVELIANLFGHHEKGTSVTFPTTQGGLSTMMGSIKPKYGMDSDGIIWMIYH